MRTPNMRAWAIVAGVLALLATPVHALAAAEPPIGTTPLPFSGFGDIAVDAASGRVFVSGGVGSSAIQVLNFSGQIVGAVNGEQGAAGLVLLGSNLYVALHDADAIATIDPQTLTETARVSVPSGTAPWQLGVAAGRFWFCSGPELASETTSGTGFTVYSGTDFPFGCRLVATTSTAPSRLIAISGDSPTTVYVYDPSTSPPTLIIKGSPEGGNPQDVVATSSGAHLVLASGAPYFLQELALSDLSRTGTYDTGAYPTAVALSPDGAWVAGGVSSSATPVHVFPAGVSTPTRSYSFYGGLFGGGLAFSPNARKVFAVSGSGTGSAAFQVLDNRLANSLTLTSSASRVRYGRTVHLTAHLGHWADDQTVSIYATPYQGTKRLIRRGAVDANGMLDTSFVMGKKTQFVAKYAGDETYAPAVSGVETVLARAIVSTKLLRFYGRSGKYVLYHAGHWVVQRGAVIPNHAGRKLGFVFQRYAGGAWHSFASASFNIHANGTVTGYIAPDVGRYRTRNAFAGDADHLGDKSPWRYVRVTR